MTFDIFLKEIGSNITALRKEKSFNQREVAELANISYRYYQSIEAGVANLTLATIFRLAEFFQVKPQALLCRATSPTKASESIPQNTY